MIYVDILSYNSFTFQEDFPIILPVKEMKTVREMEFKMERQGLVHVGDRVEVIEREGVNYSYIIEPAVAMSGCYKSRDRLKSREGVIKDIRENDRGFYIIAEFDE